MGLLRSRKLGSGDGPKGLLDYARSVQASTPRESDGDAVPLQLMASQVGAAGRTQAPNRSAVECQAPGLTPSDNHFLNGYYRPVATLARQYGVDPALVLGVAGESGFGSAGTYRRTNDAFGMTGGSTRHMTTASGPDENAREFFQGYGPQIQGSGSDVDRFVNGLLGRDPSGAVVRGWKQYNKNKGYDLGLKSWISRMQRETPRFLQACPQ